MRRFGYALVVMVAAGAALHAQGQAPPPQTQAPPQQAQRAPQPPPTNLMVLPSTMTRPEVVRVMRGFTRGLGVRCQHCHVGEGDDLSKFDFASDAKPQKEIARAMLLMVTDINTKHLAGVGEPAAGAAPGETPAPKVTCYTCHRGTTKPLTAPPPGEGRGGRGGW